MNLIISSFFLVAAIAAYTYGALVIPVPAEYQTLVNQGTIIIL